MFPTFSNDWGLLGKVCLFMCETFRSTELCLSLAVFPIESSEVWVSFKGVCLFLGCLRKCRSVMLMVRGECSCQLGWAPLEARQESLPKGLQMQRISFHSPSTETDKPSAAVDGHISKHCLVGDLGCGKRPRRERECIRTGKAESV